MPVSLPLFVAFVFCFFRSRRELLLENLVLRQQLACLRHQRKRPTLRPVDRFLWAMFSRFWYRWKETLIIVKPETVIRWHRLGFRLFWKRKCRVKDLSRPKISPDVQRLIREMASTNVGWGAPRIHGELQKLGISVSESTVSKYLSKRLVRPGPSNNSQSWKTFIDNHLRELVAIDFAVVPTVTFELLCVFVVLSLDKRKVLHFNVTKHPNAAWTAQQMIEACPFEAPGKYLLRDNDRIYGQYFVDRVRGIGFKEIKTTPCSPWQNGFVERWIGSLRRDCLEHVIAVSEDQLRRIVRQYVDYYHNDRTHLGLDKETPLGRPIEPVEQGEIVAFPRVGGLHHRYSRMEKTAA